MFEQGIGTRDEQCQEQREDISRGMRICYNVSRYTVIFARFTSDVSLIL